MVQVQSRGHVGVALARSVACATTSFRRCTLAPAMVWTITGDLSGPGGVEDRNGLVEVGYVERADGVAGRSAAASVVASVWRGMAGQSFRGFGEILAFRGFGEIFAFYVGCAADFKSVVEGFESAVEVPVSLSLLGVPLDGIEVGICSVTEGDRREVSISKSPQPTPASSAAPEPTRCRERD